MKYIEGMKGQDEGGSTEEGLELMWMALLSLSTIRSDSPVAATTTDSTASNWCQPQCCLSIGHVVQFLRTLLEAGRLYLAPTSVMRKPRAQLFPPRSLACSSDFFCKPNGRVCSLPLSLPLSLSLTPLSLFQALHRPDTTYDDIHCHARHLTSHTLMMPNFLFIFLTLRTLSSHELPSSNMDSESGVQEATWSEASLLSSFPRVLLSQHRVGGVRVVAW